MGCRSDPLLARHVQLNLKSLLDFRSNLLHILFIFLIRQHNSVERQHVVQCISVGIASICHSPSLSNLSSTMGPDQYSLCVSHNEFSSS